MRLLKVPTGIGGFETNVLPMLSFNDSITKMNNKQLRILKLVFENPIRGDVPWLDIENLLIALGANLSESNGSRVRIILDGIYAVFHHPHPRKEIDKGALKSVRRFLIEAGVTTNVKI